MIYQYPLLSNNTKYKDILHKSFTGLVPCIHIVIKNKTVFYFMIEHSQLYSII
jgi:hypothetical protein